MKKLLFGLFAILALSFVTSCSNDDDVAAPSDYVKAKIGSTEKTYENVTVVAVNAGESVVYNVIAVDGTDTNNTINFSVAESATGSNAVQAFSIKYNGDVYTAVSENSSLTSNVSVNDANNIKATFSGTLVSTDNDAIVITNGIVDVDKD